MSVKCLSVLSEPGSLKAQIWLRRWSAGSFRYSSCEFWHYHHSTFFIYNQAQKSCAVFFDELSAYELMINVVFPILCTLAQMRILLLFSVIDPPPFHFLTACCSQFVFLGADLHSNPLIWMIPDHFRKFTTSSCNQIGGFSKKDCKAAFLQSLSEMTSKSRVFAIKKQKNPLLSLMNRGKFGVMRFSHFENGFSHSEKNCHSGHVPEGLSEGFRGYLSGIFQQAEIL